MQPQPRVPCRRLQSVSLRTKAKLLCLNERMPDALFIAGDPRAMPCHPDPSTPPASANNEKECGRHERGRPLAFGRKSDVWDVDIDGLRRSNPVYCPKSHVTKWQAVQDRTVHTHQHSGKYNTKF